MASAHLHTSNYQQNIHIGLNLVDSSTQIDILLNCVPMREMLHGRSELVVLKRGCQLATSRPNLPEFEKSPEQMKTAGGLQE